MSTFGFKALVFLHRVVRGVANRTLPPEQIHPRPFSNAAIRKYAPLLSGDVVNVSGWKDGDSAGSNYRAYFNKASSYTVTNVAGQQKGLGAGTGYDEIELDLSVPLRADLAGRFDVVFNHTTLEHIYDFRQAFANLCSMSRDAVMLVVPVMQQIHHGPDFGDYWRPTTMTIAKMFLAHGFTQLVLKCNDQPFAPVYCFALAVRDPSKYEGIIERDIDFQMGAFNYGSSLKSEHIPGLLHQR